MASFDDAALSKLTAKIESKLGGSDKSQGKTAKGKPKLDPTADAAQLPPAKKLGGSDKSQGKTAKGKRKLDPTADAAQPPPSKKRSQEGKKRVEKGGKGPDSTKKPNGSKQAPHADGSNNLLDEIKALGGDEEDYKLIGDIDSEDESLDAPKGKGGADKGLQAELAKFAAGLGFEKVKPEEPESEIEDAMSDTNQLEEGSSGAESSEDEVEEVKPRDPKRKTVFEPRADWYATGMKSLPSPTSDDMAPYTAAVTALKDYAKTVLEEDTAAYNTTLAASSSRKFMSTIMSSGTMSDKVSALTLAIQDSPVHNIKALENLIGLSAKRNRGQALSAMAALVDLLGPGMILPSDRRLRTFTAQLGLLGTLQKYSVKSWAVGRPLPGKITKEHLMAWFFEDWLKDAYFKIVQNLEIWCDDEVKYTRTKAIDLLFALLRDKPEQESNLLRLLVNKLGDRERQIASRAQYLLLQLLNTHPGMKGVVISAIERDVIFRPRQDIRAQYYAVNTLNQTILSTKEPELADSLLRIYFGLFVALLKSGELNQLGAPSEASKYDKKKQTRKRARPSKPAEDKTPPNTSTQEAAEKLVSAVLTGVNRAVPFSQADQSTLESHLDTLFRITHSSNFNTSIQALMLIQQLAANRHIATERFYRTLYESLLDPRLVTSSKQALYLNLMYRSLKNDVDVRRVKAFVKRMLQILNLHQPSFVCGILYLALELRKTFPDLTTLLDEPEENDFDDEADPNALDAPAVTTADATGPAKSATAYDGRKRDPEYSNAHRSCLWELTPFLKHFHPSVDVYASGLLSGSQEIPKPELANHTLIAFLDKFVYRNAKAVDQTKGVSIMQPVVASGQGAILLSNKPSAKEAGSSLNSAAFWNKKSEDVAVDDVFFHEYFAQIGKPGQDGREKKRKAKEADDANGDEEADEDEVWEALVNSRPEVQGDSGDEDTDFDDLMSLDGSEDGLDKEMDQEDGDDDEELDFLDDSDLDSGEDKDESEDEGAMPTAGKEEANLERKKRKKAMKNLSVFASAEDYAEMLAQD
ncbi:CBF-domain-containing protein [Xylariaceae sp. FL0804]|nr:CBF-domain-containing protein [Xylariaceae sp. FL0804]